MSSISSAILDIKNIEALAHTDSSIHRLDARAKVLVSFFFIVTVVSFGKYELVGLLAFFVFPLVMILKAELPPSVILKKVVLVGPLILLVGIFNPLLDSRILVHFGTLNISAGWISFLSMILRAALTVSAGFILIGVTGFNSVCQALSKMGVPSIFAVQLTFLFRYLFLLAEEVQRASRARELRANGRKGLGLGSFGSMIGHLLLRTWSRAERIHLAMLSRGFEGQFHGRQTWRFDQQEIIFVCGWLTAFVVMRLYNISELIAGLTGNFL